MNSFLRLSDFINILREFKRVVAIKSDFGFIFSGSVQIDTTTSGHLKDLALPITVATSCVLICLSPASIVFAQSVEGTNLGIATDLTAHALAEFEHWSALTLAAVLIAYCSLSPAYNFVLFDVFGFSVFAVWISKIQN